MLLPRVLRKLLQTRSLQPVAPHVVAAFLEDGRLASDEFWGLLERMVERGLFEDAVIGEVEALPDLDGLAAKIERNRPRPRPPTLATLFADAGVDDWIDESSRLPLGFEPSRWITNSLGLGLDPVTGAEIGVAWGSDRRWHRLPAPVTEKMLERADEFPEKTGPAHVGLPWWRGSE